ncbi:hypothetical protein [Geodermatophilus amargosae]|uniref:hypothetical protein n=1 Tax=Geodermatophilus amargosae TaxID=1296565 RepID=UPI0034DF6D84
MVGDSTSRPGGRSDRLIRAYRWVCIVGAVIGVITALAFLASGDGFMAAFFAVFTLLLIPAYLCFRWALRRRPW